MPKGMKKLPVELQNTDDVQVVIDHSVYNYSSMIRKALSNIDNLDIIVKQLELVEQENSPAIVSIVLEVCPYEY